MDSMVWLWTLHMKMTFIIRYAQSLSSVWLCSPMNCSPPGSSVHGIFQARILEWVAMPSSRGFSQPRDQTQVSCTAGGFFTSRDTREASFIHTQAQVFMESSFVFSLFVSCLWFWIVIRTRLSHIQVLNTVRNSALFSSSNCWIYIFTSEFPDLFKIFLVCSIRLSCNHCLFWRKFSLVQFSRSVVSDSVTPWIAVRQASLSITNSLSLLRLMPIKSVMPSSHLILSSPSPAPNPSQHQGLFQWVNFSYEVAKVLEFELQHQSFQGTPRTDLL